MTNTMPIKCAGDISVINNDRPYELRWTGETLHIDVDKVGDEKIKQLIDKLQEYREFKHAEKYVFEYGDGPLGLGVSTFALGEILVKKLHIPQWRAFHFAEQVLIHLEEQGRITRTNYNKYKIYDKYKIVNK